LRGVIVDEKDAPVRGIREVRFLNADGGGQVRELPGDNRFGTFGLDPEEFWRVEVHAEGFDNYRGPELWLKPGEMRFVKVVMRRSAPEKKKKPAEERDRRDKTATGPIA
jgi:hypothetical protein